MIKSTRMLTLLNKMASCNLYVK